MPAYNLDPVIITDSVDDDVKSQNSIVKDAENLSANLNEKEKSPGDQPHQPIVWFNVVWYVVFHLTALYGLYLLPSAKWQTHVWTAFIYYISSLGITAGAHRLWSHRAYKARLPLRILLAVLQSMAFQNDIIEWSRDHRVHHKYSETDADPHNAKRGFFFAHCGWLLKRKHPDVKTKGKNCDLSDLYNDPVCRLQRKFYVPSLILCCFALPSVVPWYYWSECFVVAFFVPGLFRYVLLLNFTWCVNSVAHLWGNKPYDRHINPVENFIVTGGTSGEGFHNYHHTFPYDYRASEFGIKYNLTTLFIDAMNGIGQAYDCKSVSQELIDRRKARTGDGTEGFGFFQKSKDN